VFAREDTACFECEWKLAFRTRVSQTKTGSEQCLADKS